MIKTLLVFGGESTALEIAEVAQRYLTDRLSTFLVVGNDVPPEGPNTVQEQDLETVIKDCAGSAGFIISMWNQQTREKCLALAEGLGLAPYTVLHPDAYVSETASIGAGVYVAAHSSISSWARIHDHVIVNYNVTVGHDSVIGSHSVLNPGARISGNVSVGERVLIGANAFVFQGKQVGSDSLVDALTYIDRDIPPRSLCSSKRLEVHKRVF